MVDKSQLAMLTASLPDILTPYIDASVFMAHIKGETYPSRNTTRLEITTNLFEGAKMGKYKLYTSFLTIAEVNRIKETGKEMTTEELPKVQALFNEFMEHQWIVPIEVSRTVAEKAQEIGARYVFTRPQNNTLYRISPTDAIHVASAILSKCNVLMAWDKQLVKVFKGQPVEGVLVLEPYYEGIIQLTPTSGASQPAAVEGGDAFPDIEDWLRQQFLCYLS